MTAWLLLALLASPADAAPPGAIAHLQPPVNERLDLPNLPLRADGKPFTAEAYGVVDVATGQILLAHQLCRRMYPASCTKILSALVVLEAAERGEVSLDNKTLISKQAATVGESCMWLSPNEPISLRDLLKGLMVRSANDAAMALAEYFGRGNPQLFVDRMNETARRLGALDSHFVNPHGLHEGLHGEDAGAQHYTTGYDLLLFTTTAWKYPLFRELCVAERTKTAWTNLDADPKKRHAEQRLLFNRNKLLWRYDECVGVKTGSTKQAGACLVSAARRGGREVIAVTLHSASGDDRWHESEAVLRWALDEFQPVVLVAPGQTCGEVRVHRGASPTVAAMVTEGVQTVQHRLQPPPRVRLELVDRVEAPLLHGLPLGVADVTLPDGVQRRLAVVAGADVPLSRAAKAFRLGLRGLALALILVTYGAIAEAHRQRRGVLPARR
ncbi:MAG: D-alanyl-D-alanine carboxypeptidase [Armatimonadetes bacterium]|nr:D-alanyl-D-alanine carboxypeptidase [Armatimonadota bacterium]